MHQISDPAWNILQQRIGTLVNVEKLRDALKEIIWIILALILKLIKKITIKYFSKYPSCGLKKFQGNSQNFFYITSIYTSKVSKKYVSNNMLNFISLFYLEACLVDEPAVWSLRRAFISLTCVS